MKRFVFLLICISLFVLAVAPVQAGDNAVLMRGEHYLIGRGDILDVSVWKDEAQTKVVTVLPDGTISLPLVGIFAHYYLDLIPAYWHRRLFNYRSKNAPMLLALLKQLR